MAIRTLHGVVGGALPPAEFLKIGGTMEAAGVFHSLLYTQGRPGAGVAPSPGIAGAALTSYGGQLPHADAPVLQQTYLSRLFATATASGSLLLVDRLWHNSGVAPTTTGAQNVNSVAWPARDRLGATDGDGVGIGIEVSTATTNGAAVTNTTMSYTNSVGTAGRTATIPSFPATAVAGTFVPFTLQAGDQGVRSIQSVTLGTSYGGGAIHLVAYRQLGFLGLPIPNAGIGIDAVTGGFARLYDGTVPCLLWLPSATAAVTITGQYVETQG